MTSDQYDRCLLIATISHTAIGQRRANGKTEYIEHPKAVAAMLQKWNEQPWYNEAIAPSEHKALVLAALLHDVLEDTKVTTQHLRSWGVPENVITYVEYVTDPPGDPNYERMQGNGKILALKAADRISNLTDAIIDVGNNLTPKRWAKYARKTRKILLPLYMDASFETELMLNLRAHLEVAIEVLESTLEIKGHGQILVKTAGEGEEP